MDEYVVGKACRPSLWGSFYAQQGPWISFWTLWTIPQSILIRGMTVQTCLYKMRDRKQGASAVSPSVVVCDPTESQVLVRVEKRHRQLWEWSHRRYGGRFEVLSLGEAMSWRGDRVERPELTGSISNMLRFDIPYKTHWCYWMISAPKRLLVLGRKGLLNPLSFHGRWAKREKSYYEQLLNN